MIDFLGVMKQLARAIIWNARPWPVRHRVTIFVSFLACFVTEAASAYPSEAGGWDIGRSDNMCGMSSNFEGPGDTSLTIGKDIQGKFWLSIANRLWSAKKDQEYQISYVLNKTTYAGTAQGTEDYIRKGFIGKFGAEFEVDLARGDSLAIYLDDKFVRRLSLSGTAAALVAVNQCMSVVRRDEETKRRERERWANTPRDPFASASPSVGQSRCGKSVMPAPEPRPSTPEPTAPAIVARTKPDSSSALNEDIAAPLRAAQAARPATGGSENQFKQLFVNWQSIECAAAPN